MKRRLALALLYGTAFYSSTLLLSHYAISLYLCWMPGLFLAHALYGFSDRVPGPPGSVSIACNVLFYFTVFLALLSTKKLRLKVDASLYPPSKYISISIAILFAVSSIPSLNPMFPTKMDILKSHQAQLRKTLIIGDNLEGIRKTLTSQGITLSERDEHLGFPLRAEQAFEPVPPLKSTDRILYGFVPVRAYEFPCGYDLKIALVFGQDSRLSHRQVSITRVCI